MKLILNQWLKAGLFIELLTDGILGSHHDLDLNYGASVFLTSLCLSRGGACNAVCLIGHPVFYCNGSATCCMIKGSQQLLHNSFLFGNTFHGLGSGFGGHGFGTRRVHGNTRFSNRKNKSRRKSKFPGRFKRKRRGHQQSYSADHNSRNAQYGPVQNHGTNRKQPYSKIREGDSFDVAGPFTLQ